MALQAKTLERNKVITFTARLQVAVNFKCLTLFLSIFSRSQFDEVFADSSKLSSLEAFKLSKRLVQTFNQAKDKERIEIYSRLYH